MITQADIDALESDQEVIAQAIAKDQHPDARWPESPNDTIDNSQGVYPVTWAYAERCRHLASVMLKALTKNRGTFVRRLEVEVLYDEGKSAETCEEYRARPNVCDWCGYRVVEGCKTRLDFASCVNG